jgi:hypothetical protein
MWLIVKERCGWPVEENKAAGSGPRRRVDVRDEASGPLGSSFFR